MDCVKEVFEETGFIVKNTNYHGIVTFKVKNIYEKEKSCIFFTSGKDFEGHLIDSIEGSLSWIDKEKCLI